MAELRETYVDGVRCFWVDSGRPTLSASLIFRAGMVDELFATRGRIHLLEHLCLHGTGGGTLHVNGSVSLLNTTFDAHGPVDLVADHLTAVASWLAAPRLENLAHEIQILQAESRTRGSSALGDALLWRYGAQGPGLVAVDEFGLGSADEDVLLALAADIFRADNAVLALDGPPPASLRLALSTGDGIRRPPDAQPCQTPYPALYPSPGLILSGLTERSTAATLMPAVLEKSVRDRFRHQEAAAYAPWSHYEAVDTDQALVVAGSDVSPEAVKESARTLHEILGRLAADGPATNDLADVVAATGQGMRDPYAAAGFAWRVAHRTLQGHQVESAEQAIAEVEAVTPEEMRAVAADLLATALLGAPDGAAAPEGTISLERPKPHPVQGTMFKNHNWPADRSRLTINDRAMQISGIETRIGVAFEDVVGLIKYSDGVRTLVAEDGWNLTVDARIWDDGERAVALLDGFVRPDLHVAPLHDDPGQPLVRMSPMKRWSDGFRRSLATDRGMVLLMVALGALGVAAIAAGISAGGVFLGVLGFTAYREFKKRRAEDEPKRSDEAPLS